MMPKQPQVSIRGEIYEKIKAHCEKTGEGVSAFVDKLCAEFFKDTEPPAKTKTPAPKKPGNEKKKKGAKAPDMKKLRF
jgi:hypothetical protein